MDESKSYEPMSTDALGVGRRTVRAAVPAALALTFVIAGTAVGPLGGSWRQLVWMIGLVSTGAPLAWRTLRAVAAGRFATDVVATLSVITAAALGNPLPGLIIVIMQTGGEALERYAEGRASDAVRALEREAPRIAHRASDGEIVDIAVEAIAPGDVLLVRPGELVPCDAEVIDGVSSLDVSRITGEPVPIDAVPGTRIMSGSANGTGALTVRATATASESQYERIVQLVRTAQASKAPLQRLADRYAVWFTPITVAACVTAFAATRDWSRVLAVLVVATPCPLILAAPIAVIGGINRAARRQIVIRTGEALEQLGRVTTVLFDKTGTLTLGKPRVSGIALASGHTEAEVLALAAAVEEHSGHALARTVVDAARGITIDQPLVVRGVVESPGHGVEGDVDGKIVTVGARAFVAERQPDAAAVLDRLDDRRATLRAWVAIDGKGAAVIDFADELRPNARCVVSALRSLGITRFQLITGDRTTNARAVAAAAGISEAWGDLTPAGKEQFARDAVRRGERVVMVGDGTNDAPALSAATVGIALAAHGGGISAEAAPVVVLNDDLSRVVDAVRIGRETMRIARQSIWVGLVSSGIAMVFAALGHIPPATGALLQEVIDVAVILNALRAAGHRGERAGDTAPVRPVSEPCQSTCQAPSPVTT